MFFPQLDGLEKSFYSFYVCTAVRKFFFFLDPLRTGKVKIQDILACSFLDDLIEVGVGIEIEYRPFEDAVMGHFVLRFSRDVQPKGCDVTMLNYARRRHGTLSAVLVEVLLTRHTRERVTLRENLYPSQ